MTPPTVGSKHPPASEWETAFGVERQRTPRIAFLVTGAQGGSIAADFALAGLNVTMIDQWPAHTESVCRNGITVNLPTRTINSKVPALHLCQVAEIREPFDLVIMVVRAYDRRWVRCTPGPSPVSRRWPGSSATPAASR